MQIRKALYRLAALLSLFLCISSSFPALGAEKKSDQAAAINEAELQSQVMAFADRYSAVLSSATREYLARSPRSEERRVG